MASSDKKRGLGRGLSALMSDVSMDEPSTSSGDRGPASTLPIEVIVPNPDQPRKTFDPDELSDLARSISEKGVIQPLIVRPLAGGDYQLVAGERRWRAAQQASLHEVPVVIRDFSDLEVVEIAIIENIQRSDLNPVEEARGYRQLMDRFGHTQEKMAESLGKSRSHIANVLRLLQLPDSVLDFLVEGKLSAGHARALITAENPEAIAKKIVAEGLSVRAVEALVKKGQADTSSKATPTRDAPEKDADTRALEGDLSAALGMPVALSHDQGGESGSISIKYKSLDQLDELCRLLSGS